MTQYDPIPPPSDEQCSTPDTLIPTQVETRYIQVETQPQQNTTKYMFIIAMSAIFASIAITYLLTRRSL